MMALTNQASQRRRAWIDGQGEPANETTHNCVNEQLKNLFKNKSIKPIKYKSIKSIFKKIYKIYKK